MRCSLDSGFRANDQLGASSAKHRSELTKGLLKVIP